MSPAATAVVVANAGPIWPAISLVYNHQSIKFKKAKYGHGKVNFYQSKIWWSIGLAVGLFLAFADKDRSRKCQISVNVMEILK